MGCCESVATTDEQKTALNPLQYDKPVKVHTVMTRNSSFTNIFLEDATDDQVIAEIGRRNIDVHANITKDMVEAIYDFDEKPLGSGASGDVYRVTHKETKEVYACKIVEKSRAINDSATMATEIEIMKRVRHRHIVSLVELFESQTCLWLVLELITGGDLMGLVANKEDYNEVHASRHMKQILEGLQYLHSRGVVHRDIKLENVLINGDHVNGDVKIADFGLSALVPLGVDGYDLRDSGKRKSYKELKEVCGTPIMFAPELFEGAYGPQVDLWSTGCVLYELLTGEAPFTSGESGTRSQRRAVLRANVEDVKYNRVLLETCGISADAQDLIACLLTADPAQRATASEALQHPWIANVANFSISSKQRLHSSIEKLKRRTLTPRPEIAFDEADLANFEQSMIDEADVNKKAESRSLAGSRSKSTVTGMRPNTGLELVARQRERAKSDAKVTIEGAESEEEASVDRPRRQTRRSVHDFLFKKLPGQDVDLRDQVQQHVKGIKVHTAFDDSHSMDGLSPRTLVNLKAAQRKPMREVTDAELCAEGSRRKLRVYAAVTLELVKDSYDFDSELLGDGAFGEVYRVREKKSRQAFACKVVEQKDMGGVSGICDEATGAMSRNYELAILKRARHRHVVSLVEVFSSPQYMWLVLELVDGGDLRRRIANESRYSETSAGAIMKEVLDGLHYLHSCGVVHRDLKMDNVLMDGNGDAKIGALGVAALFPHDHGAAATNGWKAYQGIKGVVGTPVFAAPEMFKGEGYGPQVDMWSAGCLLFELVTGMSPFLDIGEATEGQVPNIELIELINSGSYDRSSLSGLSPDVQQLLAQLLVADPMLRLSSAEAMEHPWILRSTDRRASRREHPLTLAQTRILASAEKRPRGASNTPWGRSQGFHDFIFGAFVR